MEPAQMFDARRVAPDTHILPSYLVLPGLGGIAVNAYLIEAAEPVLVDTGLRPLREDFMRQLETIIDPADLRWIWVTHMDPDHTGALTAVLERAPQARLVTTYLGMGKLSIIEPVAEERHYLLNPGQKLDVGDRVLTALRPPTFDAPETTALTDSRTGALFSADCFGALTSEAHEDAEDLSEDDLADGVITWTTIDAPWLPGTIEATFERSLEVISQLDPSIVLGSHLPPATGMLDDLLRLLLEARSARPFVGPDQKALMEMLGAGA